MITQREDGTRIVTLGEGTTYITTAHPADAGPAVGICFAADPDKPLEDGRAVIIEIRDIRGVVSYTKALCRLLNTWDGLSAATEAALADMDACLERVGVELEEAAQS